MEKYRVAVFSANDSFSQLETSWLEFEKKLHTVYITSTFLWLKIWWDIFAQKEDQQLGFNKELFILLLYKESKLLAIAPFVKVVRFKLGLRFTFLEFIGQQWSSAFSGILGDRFEQEDMNYLIAWLYKNITFDVLSLTHIPEPAFYTPLISKKAALFSGCPTMNLSEYNSFEEYRNKIYSPHQKHNFRTRMNKMKRCGFHYECEINKVEKRQWPEIHSLSESKLRDGKNCIYSDSAKRSFMEEVCQVFQAQVLFIRLNGRPVAYRLNLYYRDWKFCIDASYDRDYHDFGVGLFSLDESIQDSFTQKLGYHCEGPGLDPYKLKFLPQAIGIYRCARGGNTMWAPFVAARMQARVGNRQ